MGLGARLGLTMLILTLLGGYIIASVAHLYTHHQNRDGRAGLSLTDIESAYRKVTNQALLLVALNRDHPADLPDDEQKILLDWLAGTSNEIRVNYDNFDFAEIPPNDIIFDRCSDCHSGNAEQGGGISLEFWDDVQNVAFSNEIQPPDDKILLKSTHAHASTMAIIGIVVALLAYLTRTWRWLVNLLIFIAGLGLLVDIGSWWLAREHEFFITLIIGGGAAHSSAMATLMLLTIYDLWLPRPRYTMKPGADKLAKAVVHEGRKSRAERR